LAEIGEASKMIELRFLQSRDLGLTDAHRIGLVPHGPLHAAQDQR
jgi:hypothetical protein